MATKTIVSGENKTPVGKSGTELFTKTRTTYTLDENGKIDPNSVKQEILYSQVPGDPPVIAATRNGTTGDFTLNKNEFTGKFYFGADAQKSLKEGALKTTTNQQIEISAKKEGLTPEQQKTIAASTANNAPDPGTSEGSQGGGLSKETAEALTKDLGKERGGTRNEFPGARGDEPLVYPITLRNEHQDVIKFQMVKYSPRALDRNNANKDLSPFADRRKIEITDIIGTAILPIPNGIGDANVCNWGSNETGVFGSELFNIADSFITGGGSAGANAIAGAVGGVQNNTSAIATSLSTKFAEAASGTTNMLSRTRGAVQNPNMELLFNGPSLRPFNFTFKLASRSPKESETIRSIIRFFKQGMSPIRTQSQLFLKAPHTFQIQYLHRNEEHKFLNKFKECALQSFNVNYTPEGQYATFNDGAMVSYQITMQFSELEPVFNDDYTSLDQNNDTEIGF